MTRLCGFIHRWEWKNVYFNPPNGNKVPVEVFMGIEEEGCRMPPPEIERAVHLRRLGYSYTVTAVREERKMKVESRKSRAARGSATTRSDQLMFDFVKGS